MAANRLLDFHAWMLADSGRTGSYRKAIFQTVREGDVVVDLGAGSGILSFFACAAGSRRVYAIEISESIELARRVCASNGFSDFVEFLKARSQNVTLPEEVDVIVCDAGSSFGLEEGMLGTILDARRRFLRPGGRVIPHALQLFIAPVESNNPLFNLDVWREGSYGLDLSSIRRFAANANYARHFKPEQVLGPPQLVATIRFDEADSEYVSGTASCIAARDGLMHGLAAWVSVELAPGISFTNSPLNPTVDWTQGFFPVETPLKLKAGDCVRTHIQTNDGQEWRWQVEVAGGITSESSSTIKAQFDHSTLGKFPVSMNALKRQLPQYTPQLSRRGEAELYLLHAFDGHRSADSLATELLEHFADCFPSQAAAAAFVHVVAANCS